MSISHSVHPSGGVGKAVDGGLTLPTELDHLDSSR
jgi:hypothetical protein